jgi:photosystem II stability/assembly factor-like uncharacterized protein
MRTVHSEVLKTKDGGNSWEVRTVIEWPRAAKVQFLSETDWKILHPAGFLNTTDAGKTWRIAKVGDRDVMDDLSACVVVFLDSKTGLALGFEVRLRDSV